MSGEETGVVYSDRLWTGERFNVLLLWGDDVCVCVCVCVRARARARARERERERERILPTRENITVHSTTLPYTL